MAGTNASEVGFGLRAINTVGQTPATSGQAEYRIQTAPGVAVNKGDPMSTQATKVILCLHKMQATKVTNKTQRLQLQMMVEQAEQAGLIMQTHY
jgi:hypothetical protein